MKRASERKCSEALFFKEIIQIIMPNVGQAFPVFTRTGPLVYELR